MLDEQAAFKPKDAGFENRVRASFARQTAMKSISAKLVSIKPGAVEIELPYQERFAQQDGFLHAGVITAIVDTACGYAALSLMPIGFEVLTIEFKANFMAPAVGDRFIARAKVVRPGRTVTVCAGDVVALKGKREKIVATMLATMMCRGDTRG